MKMAQLKERETDETVDNQLIPEEVERLRELGVEVEQSGEQDGSESGDEGFESDESDEDADEDQSSGSGGDEEDDSQEGDEKESQEGGEGDGDEDEASPEDDELDNSGLDADDLGDLKEESDIAGQEGEVSDEDVDSHVEAAAKAGAGEGRIEMANYDSKEMNEEWESRGRAFGRQLGKELVDHFSQERRTGISHGEDDGHFDSNQLIEADRGSSNVFYQRNKPDEKKYHAVIAMDDSGSMGNDGLAEACMTTGMLIKALEGAGIETTVYRFARNIRLVKSGAQSYDEVKDKVYEQRTYGGTRLLPAIEQAEEIAKHHADETFLVTVTDGSPRYIDEIKDALNTSNMKSITVQIGQDHDTFKGDYDGWVFVDSPDEVPSKTKSAFRRVVL